MDNSYGDLITLDVTGVSFWLEGKGFGDNVVKAFSDHEMDGEAILMAGSSQSGPDCLTAVIPALGVRLKVYHTIKNTIEEEERKRAEEAVENPYSPPGSTIGVESLGSAPENSAHYSSVSNDPSVKSTLSKMLEDQETYGARQTPWDRNESPVSQNKDTSLLQKVSPASSSSPPLSQMPLKRRSEMRKSLPNPFPIPMFRKYTQQNLENKKFTNDDRRHIISVLGHNVVAHVQKASAQDCRDVAEALVMKYPFLVESDSWANYLYTKCHNINRTPGKGDSSELDAPPVKRAKASKSKHEYPSLGGTVEDDVSNARNKDLLNSELKKARPQKDVLVELMKRTSVMRRKSILDEDNPQSVQAICQEWPLLKKYTYVVLELDLIMKQEDLRSVFASNWKKWAAAIVAFASAMKAPTTGVKHALRECANADLTALRCWACFLTLKKKVKDEPKDFVDIPFVLWDRPRGTPPKECVDPANNQPFIIRLADSSSDLPPQFFIIIEGNLLIECKSLTDAVFALFAVHYIFNLQYHQRLGDFYTFFEEKLFGMKSHNKHSPNYASVTTGVSTYLQK